MKRYKILIAEDDAFCRKLASEMLRSLGLVSIVQVEDGYAAWSEIVLAHETDDPFALILTDWNMSDVNGLKLLSRIRSFQITHDLPVIMMTAFKPEQVAQAKRLGANDCLVKPITLKSLQEKIERILEIKLPLDS